MKDYHNTINEQGQELTQSRRKARSQQEIVLEYFKQWPAPRTPFEIQERVLPRAPITSVRRAMTNLEKAGELIKAPGCMIPERYGKKNHAWALAPKEQEQRRLF